MTSLTPVSSAPPARTARQARRRSRWARVGLHVILAFCAVTMLVPFAWMVLTSVKSPAELLQFPPTFWPQEWTWENYSLAMDAAPFGTYFKNSLIISIGHTVMNVALASMGGYALARLPIRGREFVFIFIIAMMMIPTYTKIVPQFLIVKFMPLFGGNDIFGQGGTGWLNTWWALIIPGGLTPFAIFLFRQFYLTLPRELEEAARIDGLSEWRIYLQVYTPLIKPAIATVALLTFQDSWNNFLWPLIVTSRDDLRVIQVGLAVFQQQESTQWHYLMAGTTLATAPMVLLFIVAQRYFIQGFTNAGIK
jgi:multiple sugar transport system permease protein